MKKILLLVGGAAALIAAITGCSSVEWNEISYASPGNEVALEPGAKVRVFAAGEKDTMMPVVKTIMKEFSETEQFKIDLEDPDYWVVVNGGSKFHADSAEEATHNKKVFVTQKGNDSGGEDVLVTTDNKSSTSAMVVSIAIYSVKNLAPVYYFDVPIYDADFKGASQAIKDEDGYRTMFSDQIVKKIKDAFLDQKRGVKTALPKKADETMKNALLRGDVKAVVERAEKILPGDFNAYIEEISKGNYASKEEKEANLRNYYVLALAKEINNFGVKNLNELHAQHVAILKFTDDSGLETACPNSLARIEAKLRQMRALGKTTNEEE